jgi:hypothetical protein
MVPSLDCPVVELEPPLLVDVVLVGFRLCWVRVCLFVYLFVRLLCSRLDLDLDLEIAFGI